jgi:predicted RNA-binding protein with PUA-like domain
MAPVCNYWLIRSPYQHRTWDDVLLRNLFRLQGIRNAEASRNIGQMRVGDLALFYNNIGIKAIYGILEISKPSYVDPTTNEAKWMAVDAIPVQTFDPPIAQENLKGIGELAECSLLTRPRLSAAKVSPEEFQTIIHYAQNEPQQPK